MSRISQNLSKYKGKAIPLSVAIRDNGLYMMNLKQGVAGLGKRVLGVAAAETLKMAVLGATKHDSSRAAANWDIAIGGDARTTLAPAKYGETPIGDRGDAGANMLQTWEYKKMTYGLQHQTFQSGFWEGPVEGGALWSAIGIGVPGPAPSVDVYNPLMGENISAPDGRGYTYAFNAFFGATEPAFENIGLSLAQTVGNGYIPWFIQQLNSKLKQASSGGKF